MKEKRQLLSVYEAAERLGLSPWTIRAHAYKGLLASHKIGTRLLFDDAEIERVIAESERSRLPENAASEHQQAIWLLQHMLERAEFQNGQTRSAQLSAAVDAFAARFPQVRLLPEAKRLALGGSAG